MSNLDLFANRFRMFATNECKNSSQLYEILSQYISEDPVLLQLSSHARFGQPVPNLFFGAIHYLLLNGAHHPLANYYPSLSSSPLDPKNAFPVFQDFCLSFYDQIIHLLQTRSVQTNEVRRCTYLYPTFCLIYQLTNKPLALLEMGTSSGLQLLWDQYAYLYDPSKQVYGNQLSKFILSTKGTGNFSSILLPESPPVVNRIGIDLHINDLTQPEDQLWLRALIWPEHRDRVNLFKHAASIVQNHLPQLIEGDGIQLLSKIVNHISQEHTLVIFHTHVANQIPLEGKKNLLATMNSIGQTRDVFHVYNNIWDSQLHLDSYINGEFRSAVLAETEGHGGWFNWLYDGK